MNGKDRLWNRALKRRLGESTSPEGLIASFRTREVAEPALQGTGASADLKAVFSEIGLVRYRFGDNEELMRLFTPPAPLIGRS